MISDISVRVLQYIDGHEAVDSLHLAEQFRVDHQKVVGAVKSLQCLGDIVLPVDLRADVTSPHMSSRLGNKLAPVVIGLPVGVEGAVPRLWAMRRNLDSLRTSADPVVVYVAAAALMASVPGRVARKVLSSVTGKATLQFSSLPGPTSTLFVGGHPLKGVYPLLPAQNNLGLAVSVFTYVDQVYVAIISDSTLGPAASTLLHNLHCQIDLLWQLLLHRRVPGESRSHVLLRRTDVTGSPVRELRLRLTCVQEEVQRLAICKSPTQKQNVQNSESSGTEQQDAARLQNLKTEFSELLSELHRRNSAAVGGNSPLFEDEEVGGELWHPRRRAMSCSSSRYSSHSLMGLLSAARPASFIESCSNRIPENPSNSVAHRSTPNEHVLSNPTMPASYTDTHSTSICIGQISPLFCRTTTSECRLPGSISPEEFICNKDNPVRPMECIPATVSHPIQHSTFCDTNITVISEHPLEVRNCDDNIPHLSAGMDESGIKISSSSTCNTRIVLQNKYVDSVISTGNCERGARNEDITCRSDTETDMHTSSCVYAVQTNSKGTTLTEIQNTIHSLNSSHTYSVDSSVKPSISGAYMPYCIDVMGNEDTSHKESIFVNCPQYFPAILPEVNVAKYFKGSVKPMQSNVSHCTQTTNGKNCTVLQTQKEILCSENMSAQNVAYNELNTIAVINSEYSTPNTMKGPIKQAGEKTVVNNLVCSTDLTCSTSAMNAQCFPPHLENIQNKETFSVDDTTVGQAATYTNASIVNHNTDMHLHTTNILDSHDKSASNLQKEIKHTVLNETTSLLSKTKTMCHSKNTRDSGSHRKQDCVITLTKTCREKYETPKDSITTDYPMTEKDSDIRTYTVTSVSSLQTEVTEDMSVLELACSPSSSVSNSTVATEQSIGYQIMESPDTTSTTSLVSSKSACSSISVTSTSTSSINTVSSSNTFPPSTVGSPVH